MCFNKNWNIWLFFYCFLNLVMYHKPFLANRSTLLYSEHRTPIDYNISYIIDSPTLVNTLFLIFSLENTYRTNPKKQQEKNPHKCLLFNTVILFLGSCPSKGNNFKNRKNLYVQNCLLNG